jgi:branched-chain amino acid transport system substrate-binding protein
LVDYITFTEPVNDFTEIIERLKGKKVDIFIPVVSGAESAALLVRQSKQLGFKPPVFYAAGLAFEHPDLPKLLSDAPELLQGIFTHSFLSATIKHPPANEFYQRFYKRWGEYPSVHATEAYSAMIFLLECIQKTGSDDPAAVRETVKNADIPTGVRVIYWGIKFDERNQNIRANLFQVAQWQIIEGQPQLVCVGPPEIAMYNMIPTWKS